MDERSMIATRVTRASARARSKFGAHNHRHGDTPTRHVMVARRVAGELVHGERQEITELNFHNGPHPIDRRADGEPDHRRLGDRRVQDSILSEFLHQSARDTIGAAKERHILAHNLAYRGCGLGIYLPAEEGRHAGLDLQHVFGHLPRRAVGVGRQPLPLRAPRPVHRPGQPTAPHPQHRAHLRRRHRHLLVSQHVQAGYPP